VPPSQKLVLDGNALSELPVWIGEFTQLQELSLRKNALSDVPEQLALLPHLTSLGECNIWQQEFGAS